ncbi:MAG: thermonuclease family protein [Parvularculaceae bacterium]
MASLRRLPQLSDGQTVNIGDREFFLSDIIAPTQSRLVGGSEPGASFSRAALQRALSKGTLGDAKSLITDRWGRLSGPVEWIAGEKLTTLQELLLEAGAARVFPQSITFDFIGRCLAAEAKARKERKGNWRLPDWQIRNSNDARLLRGFQVWRGPVKSVGGRGSRVYVNFGADYRTDLTATVTRGEMRRWRTKIDDGLAGANVELRGIAVRINGPSVELRHELQLRHID